MEIKDNRELVRCFYQWMSQLDFDAMFDSMLDDATSRVAGKLETFHHWECK